MRTAQQIVDEYRKKGRNDLQIHALATTQPEPLRSQIYQLLNTSQLDKVCGNCKFYTVTEHICSKGIKEGEIGTLVPACETFGG